MTRRNAALLIAAMTLAGCGASVPPATTAVPSLAPTSAPPSVAATPAAPSASATDTPAPPTPSPQANESAGLGGDLTGIGDALRLAGVTLTASESEGRPSLIGSLGGVSVELVADDAESRLVELNTFITLSELESAEGRAGLEAIRQAANLAAPGAGDHLLLLIESNTEGEGGSQTREFGDAEVYFFVLPTDDLAGFEMTFQ